jgi:PAS domain S-box-containing protein
MLDIDSPAGEIASLREQLHEAQAVLAALRSGAVDALVMGAPGETRIYTLEGAETPYRMFVETMSDGAATVDGEGNIAYANGALSRLLRMPLAKLIGAPARELVVPADRDRMEALLREVVSTPVECEVMLQTGDGSVASAHIAATPLRQANSPAKSAIVVQDLQSAREAALHARSLIEASLDAMVTIGVDGRIADANAATAAMVGLPRERVVGTDFAEYFTEPEHARDGYRRVFAEGSVRNYPLTLRSRDGSLVELVYNASIYRDSQGKVAGVFAAARDVTARNAAERAARQLAAIVESSDDAIYGKTLDGIVTSWNRGAERMFGYTAGEMMSRPVSILAPPEHQEEVPSLLARVAQGERIGHFETVRVRKDGVRIDVSISISPVRDEQGRIVGASTNARDITAQRRVQEALRVSEERFRTVFEASSDCILVLDRDYKYLYANEAAIAHVGATRDQVLGRNMRDALAHLPDFMHLWMVRVDRAFASGEQCFVEDVSDVAGRRVSSESTISPLRNSQGEIYAVSVVYRDVTVRKEAEQKLHEAHARLQAFVEADIVGVVTAAADGSVLDANDYYLRLIGFSRAELEADQVDWRSITPQRWLAADEVALQELAAAGRCRPYEKQYLRRDGTLVWVLLVDAMLPGPDRQIAAFALDITERKRTEEQLRQSELRYRFIADNIADLVVMSSADGTWTYVSPSARAMLGYEPQELLGGADWTRVHPDDASRVQEALLEMSADGITRDLEFRLPCKDGRLLWMDATIAAAKDRIDAPASFIAILRDATARRTAQAASERERVALEEAVAARTAQLEAANKELESFAYSVSHDLRAPLRAIDGFSHVLLEDYAQRLDDDGKDSLRRVREASQRMGELIDGMLQLSRITRGELTLMDIDLSAVAVETIQALRAAEPQREVSVSIQPGVNVRGDIRLLRSVMENLLANAWKFTGTTSAARIDVDCQDAGSELVVSVRDNGAGFDMRYVDKLFIAFQRLHPATEFPGTGVGLATVKRVIARLGGRVWAEGAVGQGATFHFSLPKADRP